MVNAALGAATVFFLIKAWPWLLKKWNTWIDEKIDSRIKENKKDG